MHPPPLPVPGTERRVFLLPGGVPLAMRLIPAGSFRMGSRGVNAAEEPVHTVRIPEPFWLGETPVTQAQFAVWTTAESVEHRNEFGDPPRPENPAENLDWRQANAYCDWLARILPPKDLPPGHRLFCLPTEAEWEHACRAGTETEYHTGDGEAALAEAGWFGEEWEKESTHPVRQKRANAYGLFDLHGNVWEWCHDLWDDDAYRRCMDGGADPGCAPRSDDWRSGIEAMTDAKDGRYRVMRGGSWVVAAGWCRSAYRVRWWPVDRDRSQGFRVCLVRGPADEGGAREQPVPATAAAGVGGRGTRPETDAAKGADAEPDLAHATFPRGASAAKEGPR